MKYYIITYAQRDRIAHVLAAAGEKPFSLEIARLKPIERLTSGDVSLPPTFKMLSDLQSGTIDVVRADEMQNYGDRRAAAAVLAEQGRLGSIGK